MEGLIRYFVYGTSFVGILALIYEVLKICYPSITAGQ
jgi:hypothetical protein